MFLKAGDKLGPYEIISLIGKGGMGEVFRAHDPRTGRDVAIKVSAERFSERFDHEVRAVAALNHPNICTLFDVGPDYLVMEFIEGELLEGPVPLPGCDSRTVDPGRESLVGGLDRLRWRPPHRSTRHQLPLFRPDQDPGTESGGMDERSQRPIRGQPKLYSFLPGLRQPGENANFGRNFRFKERMNLNVRVEFVDIFNRMQLPGPALGNFASAPVKFTSGPHIGLYSSGFGTINPTAGTQGSRTGSFVARIQF